MDPGRRFCPHPYSAPYDSPICCRAQSALCFPPAPTIFPLGKGFFLAVKTRALRDFDCRILPFFWPASSRPTCLYFFAPPAALCTPTPVRRLCGTKVHNSLYLHSPNLGVFSIFLLFASDPSPGTTNSWTNRDEMKPEQLFRQGLPFFLTFRFGKGKPTDAKI